MNNGKSTVQVSKAWASFHVILGLLMMLMGIVQQEPFGLVLGLGVVGAGLFFRSIGKSKQCAYCKSILNQGATVCSKCAREQPKSKEAA